MNLVMQQSMLRPRLIATGFAFLFPNPELKGRALLYVFDYSYNKKKSIFNVTDAVHFLF